MSAMSRNLSERLKMMKKDERDWKQPEGNEDQ